MTSELVDLSHFQAAPNFAAMRSGGVAGAILKATEGTTYLDPTFAARRLAARGEGLAVGAYHFTRLGSPAAEAAWFVRALGGGLAAGEFACLDLEVAAAGVEPVAWVGQWLDAMTALRVPVRLLYLNQSELAGHNWAPIVARGVLLWLADYDRNPAVTGPHGPWPTVAVKQFTDAGTVPGVSGAVDVDVLFGPITDLTGGAPAPTPAPIVLEDDMRLIRDPNGTVWRWTDGDLTAITDQSLSAAAQRAWGALVDVSAAELAAIQADCAAAAARRDALIADVHGKLTTPYDLTGRPTTGPDDLYGHVMNTEALLITAAEALTALAGQTPGAPGMPCQGRAVLGALATLGQAANAAATAPA